MNSDDDLPHQPDTFQQQKPRSFKPRKPPTLFAAFLLITFMAGTGGYLLGIRNGQLSTVSQSIGSPTPPRSSLRPTGPQDDQSSNRHICQQSFAISPDRDRVLTVKVDSNYHRYLIINNLPSTPTLSQELLLFDQPPNTGRWEQVTSGNWSPDGKYVYLLVTLYEGAYDFYVFKSNAESFGNNRKYLLASELGYDLSYSLMDSIRWISSTQIAFRAWPLPGPFTSPLTYSEFLFDIEKQTFMLPAVSSLIPERNMGVTLVSPGL